MFSPQAERCNGTFVNRAEWCFYLKRSARGIRDAIYVVPNRKNAGIVSETEFRQYLERPKRSRGDRVARRSVAVHRATGNPFNHAFRTPRVFPELLGSQFVD